ncbi:MAG: DUF4058 family protein [Haliscomenobacter sp.]|nr:DUF4058 family protein [Haliscomenobacter sp.]
MVSPFPGMDPYLEGYLWPDVQNKLSNAMAELLGAVIAPKYVARIELYTVADSNPEGDVGIMYPDVELFRRKEIAEEPLVNYQEGTTAISEATITIPDVMPVEVRIPTVEIRDRFNNQLITAIEVLSPVNKREPGLAPYREKRRHLHTSGVHLLEIDLIRRGQRPFAHPFIPRTHYIAMLTRAGEYRTDVWGVNIQDPLPVLPVPLKAPDPDVPLDLGQVLRMVYERSLYQLSIDYTQLPPPPEFTESDLEWMRSVIKR